MKAHPIYLEDRARHLMAMVKYHVIRNDGVEVPVRAFPAVSHAAQEGDTNRLKRYTHFEIVRKDPDKSAQVIDAAWAELQGWTVRHAIYRETLAGFEDRFGGVFEAIEKAGEATDDPDPGFFQVAAADPPVVSQNGAEPEPEPTPRPRKRKRETVPV
jgi:hypothetical protein